MKYFTLNESLKNKMFSVSFQGVEVTFYVWLNGHFVGYSEDSFTSAEFELTPYLCEGTGFDCSGKQFQICCEACPRITVVSLCAYNSVVCLFNFVLG